MNMTCDCDRHEASSGKSALDDELEYKLVTAENKADILAEDIECQHMCLDGMNVPMADSGGNVYSMWGAYRSHMRSNAGGEPQTTAQEK